MAIVQPGWHPDPWHQAERRWWDGAQWTGYTQSSPPDAPPIPSAGPWVAGRKTMLGGAGLVVLGSMLPWVELTAPLLGSITVNGTSGDGILTMFGGIAVAGLSVIGSAKASTTWPATVALLVTLGVFAVAAHAIANLTSAIRDVEATTAPLHASVGIGLWIVVAGSIVSFVGCIRRLRRRANTSAPGPRITDPPQAPPSP